MFLSKRKARTIMVWIVFILGSFGTVVALAALIYPGILQKIVHFLSKGNRLFLVGAMRCALGIML